MSLLKSNLSLNKYPCLEIKDNNFKQHISVKRCHVNKIYNLNDNINTFLVSKVQDPLLTLRTCHKKLNGYLIDILFNGLNYSAKRIKMRRPKYFVDMHRSEIFICNEKAANEFKSRVHKRRLLFFSYNKRLIDAIIAKIKAFRIPDTYTGKGFYTKNDLYKTKKGKVR